MMRKHRDYRKTYPDDPDGAEERDPEESRRQAATQRRNKQGDDQPTSVERHDFNHQLFSMCITLQSDVLKWTTDRRRCEESLQRDFELLLLALRCSLSEWAVHHQNEEISSRDIIAIHHECKKKLLEVHNWLQYYDLLKRQCPSILIYPQRQHGQSVIEIQQNKVYSLPQLIALLPLKVEYNKHEGGQGQASQTSSIAPKVLERVISARTSPRPSFAQTAPVAPSNKNEGEISASSVMSTVGESLNHAWTSATSTMAHHLTQVPHSGTDTGTHYMKPPHVAAVKSFFARHMHHLTGAIPLPSVAFPPVLKKLTQHSQSQTVTGCEHEPTKVTEKSQQHAHASAADAPKNQHLKDNVETPADKIHVDTVSSSHWSDGQHSSSMTMAKGQSAAATALESISQLRDTIDAFLDTCHEYHHYFKQRVKWIQCERDIYRAADADTEIEDVDPQVRSGCEEDFQVSSDSIGVKLTSNTMEVNDEVNEILRHETFLGLRKEENVTIATMSLSKDGRCVAFVTISGRLTVVMNHHSNGSATSSSSLVILKSYECGRQCPTAIAISVIEGVNQSEGQQKEEEILVAIGFPLLEVKVIHIKIPSVSNTAAKASNGKPSSVSTIDGKAVVVSLKSYWLEQDHSPNTTESASMSMEGNTTAFSQQCVSDWINTIHIIANRRRGTLIVIGREHGTLTTMQISLSQSPSTGESERDMVISHYDYKQAEPRTRLHRNQSQNHSDSHGKNLEESLDQLFYGFQDWSHRSVMCGVTCIDYSKMRQVLVTGHSDGLSRLYQLSSDEIHPEQTTLKLLLCLQGGHRGGISAVAISRNGLIVYTGGVDHQVLVWDAMNGDKIRTLIDFAMEIQQQSMHWMKNSMKSSNKHAMAQHTSCEVMAAALDKDHFNIRSITLSSELSSEEREGEGEGENNSSSSCDSHHSLVSVTLQGGQVIMIDHAMTEQTLSWSASPLLAAKDKLVVSMAMSDESQRGCCYLAVIGGTDSLSVLDLHHQVFIGSLSMSSMHFQCSNHHHSSSSIASSSIDAKTPPPPPLTRMLSIGCHAAINSTGDLIVWSYSTALIIFQLKQGHVKDEHSKVKGSSTSWFTRKSEIRATNKQASSRLISSSNRNRNRNNNGKDSAGMD
jgi:WD40 repeat protein